MKAQQEFTDIQLDDGYRVAYVYFYKEGEPTLQAIQTASGKVDKALDRTKQRQGMKRLNKRCDAVLDKVFDEYAPLFFVAIICVLGLIGVFLFGVLLYRLIA